MLDIQTYFNGYFTLRTIRRYKTEEVQVIK